MDIISGPFGKLLYFIYNQLALKNYGFTIIIFTFIIKLLLLPLTIKQLKSTAKMNEIQPYITEAQQRYKNDKEKLSQETMRIYQEHHYNPYSGCLPLIIQLPILLSLFAVITKPLTYLLNKAPEVITQLGDFVKTRITGSAQHIEIQIMNFFNANPGELSQFPGVLSKSELISFNFLGIDLGRIPTIKPGLLFGADAKIWLPLLIIPILAVGTTYLMTELSTAAAKKSGTSSNAAVPAGSGAMKLMGPALTLLFSFQLPAGVGLYWLAGNVFQILQQLVLNYFDKKNKESKLENKEDTTK